MFKTVVAELDEDDSSGELPGIDQISGNEDTIAVPIMGESDGTLPERTEEIETAAMKEIFVKGEKCLFEAVIPAPIAVATVAGDPGRVARILPNEASCLRLVSAVLMEISETWETGKVYLSFERY